MTVSYNSDVSSVSSINFIRLLLRWKGSIWKSVSSELLIWTSCYILIAIIYHYLILPSSYYPWFNEISRTCEEKLHEHIPLTFMLAFFVSIIVERWRATFSNMGWIENCALMVNSIIVGKSYEASLIRRNIIRYLVLSQILTFRDISMRVRRRFPNIDSIIKAGFLTIEERLKLDGISLSYNKYWVPINWALSNANKAYSSNYIVHPPGHTALITEIKTFRTNLATICNFDWVPVPIAYPQVVFFAVRMYFIISLITRQYLRNDPNIPIDWIQQLVRPIMTIIEFICLVGWMKVAEALLNPLGEDDDDFESNFLIDKNIFTGMKILDTFDDYPPLYDDDFSNPDAAPIYSIVSQKLSKDGALVGSVSNVTLAQYDDDIPMVPVVQNVQSADNISQCSRLSSIRRRCSSRPSSIRLPKKSIEVESNEREESPSPTKPARFQTKLSKVDENEAEIDDSSSSIQTQISRI